MARDAGSAERQLRVWDVWDIDGDGQARELLVHSQATVWFEAGTLPDGKHGLIKHEVSNREITFGGGVGDVNGDGRPDILRPAAWYEDPANRARTRGLNTPGHRHGAKDGQVDHTPQMLVYDVDSDGSTTSSQVRPTNTASGGIDRSAREADTLGAEPDRWHVDPGAQLALGDLDGDGDLDLVAGKRFMAHNGSDPDEFGPLCVYWYQIERGTTPHFTRYAITHAEGIGSGLSAWVVDMDQDGDLDIVTTGKFGGPVLFENRRKVQ